MTRRVPFVGIFLLSAATLLYELALMRLFAVSEWYHFAFVSVSVALLGNAASGTLAALLAPPVRRRLDGLAAACLPAAVVASYLVLTHAPFDSYALAWDSRQAGLLLLDYASLVLPFALSGYLLVRALGSETERSHERYAASLSGAAAGGASLGALLPLAGIEGVVMVVAALTAAAGLLMSLREGDRLARPRPAWIAPALSILGCALLLALRPTWMAQRVSPYKGLSQALRAQGAEHVYREWSAGSRVDVVSAPSLHPAPGLSLSFRGRLPAQLGLTIDAGDLSALSRRGSPADADYLPYLPGAIVYALRPGARALLVNPRGGMEVALALYAGSGDVLVAEDDALVLRVVRDRFDGYLSGLYRDPRVRLAPEGWRHSLARDAASYGLIVLPLAQSFHPLAAGAYSLAENYTFTVESFSQALARLSPGGLLAATRWVQDPPAEAVRAAATLAEALARRGVADAGAHLIIYRSWSTVTLLTSPAPFSAADVRLVGARCAALGFDLLHGPGLQPAQDSARFAVASSARDAVLLRDLLDSDNRADFFRRQDYDLTPPTDDRPFFEHYFRWRQLPDIVERLGRTWQPFGGSGYLLVILLLLVSLVVAGALVAVALRASRRHAPRAPAGRGRVLAYFALVGLAYMLLEMPLAQHLILYLGQPARAYALTLTTLLLASGLGSLLAPRVSLRWALPALGVAALVAGPLVGWLAHRTLGWPLPARMTSAAVCLAPLGLLMGLPFAGGLRRLGRSLGGALPWVWAANGGASVVGAILAAVLALSVGLRAVVMLSGACYLAAWLCLWPEFASDEPLATATHAPAAQN